MDDVLLVSKPIAPPWNDSGKNLVRDLGANGRRYQYRVLTPPGVEPPGPNAIAEPIYPDAGKYAPGLRNQLAVVKRLLLGPRPALAHFFFAPNPKTSTIMRFLKPALRRAPTLHTVTSRPARYDGIARLLFANRVVALSQHTADQLQQHGVQDVRVIPPSVPTGQRIPEERKDRVLAALGLPTDKPLVLFAGDYSFGTAHRRLFESLPIIMETTNAHVVFAVRTKTEASRTAEESLKLGVQDTGWGDRVHFHNEINDMEALAAAVTLNVLPADTLYAKMDFPLVLLESMREEVPVVVSDHGPLPELVQGGGGRQVPVNDTAALAQVVCDLLTNPEHRSTMGRQARQTVLQQFGPEPMARRYETLYDELLTHGVRQ